MTLSTVFLLIAIICVGLMAGLFFSYSFSVMPGLHLLDDLQYLSAIQSINRAIQNPVFFIVFFGTLITLPVATYLQYSQPVSIAFLFLISATIIYFGGAFLVTASGNIPINNALDKIDLSSASKELLNNQRQLFETKWNSLNRIRTVCSLLSFICSVLALYYAIKGVEGQTNMDTP